MSFYYNHTEKVACMENITNIRKYFIVTSDINKNYSIYNC